MASVLVIEREPSAAAFIGGALTAAGHLPAIADNARDAIERLKRHSYPVVVLEVLLPDIDGVEIIRTIRNGGHDCGIIAVSGGGRFLSASDALTLAKGVGADRTLRKPFSEAQIVDLIADVVAARSLETPFTKA